MTLLKKFMLMAALAATAIACSGCPPQQPLPPDPPLQLDAIQPVDAKLGIGFWPSDYTPQYIDSVFAILVQGADIAIVQKWDPFDTTPNKAVDKIFDNWLDRAGSRGLEKYLALEPFSDDRKDLRLPEDWRGPAPDLTNPAWRAAYKNVVIEEARRHRPNYLNVAVEANMFYQHRPQQWPAFCLLMKDLRNAVKEISPQTLVFCSFQYEVLQGSFAGKSSDPQWELLADKAPDQDLLGISSYPLFLDAPYDPARVPTGYFKPLADRSSLPLFIAEIGWYSAGDVNPPSSPAKQAAFVARLPELCAGNRVSAVCWVGISDLKHIPALKEIEKALPQFFSLALHDDQLNPKPAWHAWQALHRPVQQGAHQ